MPNKTLYIATACFFNAERALLVVRKRGTQAWMLPGGKLDPGESAEQALLRELHEELQLQLAPEALLPLGRFQAVAANEADTQVVAEVFQAAWPQGQLVRLEAEIEAMQWLALDAPLPPTLAPLLREQLVPQLRQMAGV